MSAQEPQIQDSSYRGWLALVIILGVLIFVMVGALIAGMFLRAGGGSGAPYLATVAAAGGHIESTQLDGNRILVRLSGGAGGEELVVLDATTGRIIGRIAVAPRP